MSRLPNDVMNKITSYNFTTYSDNNVAVSFDYESLSDREDPHDSFDCDIRIGLDSNIGEYWRRHLVWWVNNNLYPDPYSSRDGISSSSGIQSELKDFKTIFGNTGNFMIDAEQSNQNTIRLTLRFMYEKEGYDPVDFMSERGLRMRKAAAFLAAHTLVNTFKDIIPKPDTMIQDYLTLDEDGDRIDQRGNWLEDYNFDEYRIKGNDYKLHKKDKFIYSLDFWMKKISYEVTTQGGRVVPAEEIYVKFTLVNNKRLPITRGEEGVYMRQLLPLLKF